MPYDQLKQRLANQPSDEEMAQFEALAAAQPKAVIPQENYVPSTEESIRFRQAQQLQEQKMRDAERAKLPYAGLRQALYQPAVIPANSKETDKLQQQLEMEKLKEKLAQDPEFAKMYYAQKNEASKLAGEQALERAKQQAAAEAEQMPEWQRKLKGGTPGIVDLSK